MPESVHGAKREVPDQTWDWVSRRKLDRSRHMWPETPAENRRTNVPSTRDVSKAFWMSMKATKVWDEEGEERTETSEPTRDSAPHLNVP